MSGDIALDFGSSVTRIADARGTVLLEEPTVAAVDADARRLLAFGTKALGLATATAGRVSLVRPVRHGQLVDIALAEDVLVEAVRAAGVSRLSHPRVLACIHAGATQVQQRALDRALRRAGARQVRFIEQPIASAVGAGLPIEEPEGSMVLDIGAGTTDIGVLALGAIVTSASLPIGADDFDEAIRMLLARSFDLVVDISTAGDVRRSIGSARLAPNLPNVEVSGREGTSGRPSSVVVSPEQVRICLDDLLRPIVAAAVECIATAPPDLANDLLGSGIHLSGGGSQLDGLDQRFASATGLPVHVTSEPGRSSVRGAARCLSMFDALSPALSAAPRR
jgi:rod shape-determining protein MreB